jgi:hypothetical protein
VRLRPSEHTFALLSLVDANIEADIRQIPGSFEIRIIPSGVFDNGKSHAISGAGGRTSQLSVATSLALARSQYLVSPPLARISLKVA